MRTLRTIADVRVHVGAARRAGRSVGLVPTMGAFHAGHEALIRAARETCDDVVVSLFVNPSQFEEPADLAAYPRGEERDAMIAAELGADALFAPPVAAIYPDGFATTVHVGGLSGVLEGAQRGAAHFDGVCTVVCKLFAIVAPDVAFFGQKDAQQAAVVKRMVTDLEVPTRIEICATVREPDGLALSSRNVHLAPDDRARAVGLRRALDAAEALVSSGERSPERVTRAAHDAMAGYGVEPEYLELVTPDTLDPVQEITGEALLALAARVGATRLIDNTLLRPTTTNNGRA